jgi:hypothetical protein
MDKELLKILEKLRKIQPDPDYSRKSRLLILTSERQSIKSVKLLPSFRFVNLATLTSLVIVLILITFGGVYYLSQSNQQDLIVRANEVNASIQIKLDEIKYLLESQSASLNLLDIQNTQTLLEKATNELKEASSLTLEGKKLEEVLQKIKNAQEILSQIDSKIDSLK